MEREQVTDTQGVRAMAVEQLQVPGARHIKQRKQRLVQKVHLDKEQMLLQVQTISMHHQVPVVVGMAEVAEHKAIQIHLF